MSAKLTPWFDGKVKPVHIGVYMQMCGFKQLVGYQYWNGSYWGLWGSTIDSASDGRPARACNQDDKWRGLAVKS